mmetsp:Transcript_33354/g.106343  ORF Transcript_33354/g.106343 Transcript_33354/m.106343 type:complete len:103 (+) Transcript_33354:186-494(+)
MTAFLLKRLRRLHIAPGAEVLDFCCGSGTIAQALLQLQPRAALHLAEADALAVEAARCNVSELAERCYLGDGWGPVPAGLSLDHIILSPPVQPSVSALTASS